MNVVCGGRIRTAPAAHGPERVEAESRRRRTVSGWGARRSASISHGWCPSWDRRHVGVVPGEPRARRRRPAAGGQYPPRRRRTLARPRGTARRRPRRPAPLSRGPALGRPDQAPSCGARHDDRSHPPQGRHTAFPHGAPPSSGVLRRESPQRNRGTPTTSSAQTHRSARCSVIGLWPRGSSPWSAASGSSGAWTGS